MTCDRVVGRIAQRVLAASVGAIVCGLSLLMLGTPALAHEIGTTRVSASFADGRYRIEIVTDAGSLLEKLESVADAEPTPSAASARVIDDRLHALQHELPARIQLLFDGAVSTPDIRISVEPAIDAMSVPAATLTLSGPVPAGAQRVTWKYGWTFATYALTVHEPGASAPTTLWLEGSAPSPPLALGEPSSPRHDWRDTARRYLALGFTHILPLGVDHVLFVLGLFLLNSRPRTLLLQVSAFTVAHSMTLGLSMYGLVSLPSQIVEPAIALSIAYIAIENLLVTELRTWRIWLVFGFGLLHGLGFAGVLAELGLPRGEFLTALVSFNIGVEAAQLTVIGAAFLVVGIWFAARPWYRMRIAIPASAAIACTGLVWAVQRMGL